MSSMFSSFFSSSSNSSLSAFNANYDLSSCPPLELPTCKFYGSVKCKRPSDDPANDSSGDSTDVSVFVWEGPDRKRDGQNCVKRLKTLRHPAVLKYVADAESDAAVMLATERVEPMVSHIRRITDEDDGDDALTPRQRALYLSWGIFQVMRGVGFMSADARLKHNNLHGDAIFVNAAGDWKLFGFECVTTADSEEFPGPCSPALQKYAAPEVSDSSKRRAAMPYSRDMWGLGCIVWEAFNGSLPAARNLGTIGDIPKPLSQLYMELVAANPAKRPNPKERLESMRRQGGYFKNDLIDCIVFLEELQIKEESEKQRFYQGLSGVLDNFPRHVCTWKILPELIKAFEFGNAGAAVLGPLFKLGKALTGPEYVRRIVPCVVKLFASNDRNARFKLLNQVESFVEHLDAKVVNDQVFPHIQNGFLDQEPIIREKTVIAMIHLAPKLSQSNLDDVVIMKHFSRLLRDEQAGIRTNTTVCLGKIAKYLQYGTRQKVLIPGFAGKLRDPFPPCRIAAINALAATQNFYTVAETGTKVLPAICCTLTDPEEPVRKQGFKVVRGFVDKLEQVSNDPSLREEMEAEVQVTHSEGGGSTLSAAAGWASWAVGAIGAKFYKSSIPPPQQQQQSQQQPDGEKEPRASPKPTPPSRSRETTPAEPDVPKATKDTDGWGDADDDDWGSLEESFKATKIEPEPVRPAEPTRRATATTNKVEADDWNAWDEPSASLSNMQVDKEEEKRQREEKRRQRRAEMEAKKANRRAGGGGAMKLGSKKTAID